MNQVIQAIESQKPFLILRPNLSPSSVILQTLHFDKVVDFSKIEEFQNESGIYFRTKQVRGNKEDLLDLKEYVDVSTQLYDMATLCACFADVPHLKVLYDTIPPHIKISMTTLLPKTNPVAMTWIKLLTGKRFLVITRNPKRIIHTIQTVKGSKPSNPLQSFIYQSSFTVYSGYNCFNGKKPHTSWKETFQHMCDDISDKTFDVALLSFGGYNYPLGHYMYKNMKKTVIHLGPDIVEWF